ncbi:AccB: acetyl-CoA carboxylase, biotin carboxyl carrier protein [Desulfosarcina variabilis str. Montpellier]|uniref:acetyl-CoA carboxylase biotin carboxyl carrier protein n=1 Tax=Desulfosarcina variabilis TaxID=2300 RepID=UPI003AFA1037
MTQNIFDVFDVDKIESITDLIHKLGESSFDFLKLENGVTSILISKNGLSDDVEVNVSNKEQPISVSSVALNATQEEILDKKNANVEEAAVTIFNKEVQEEVGYEMVKSPSHGLFYAQSSPGEPPYVVVGTKVQEGQTVGIFEVMKVFSSIAAPVDGEIVEIYIKDNEVIETGQPLMKIKI